jgi:hypothetical protein
MTMELLSQDLLRFIDGPLGTTKARLLKLLSEWQADIAGRVFAGEPIRKEEMDRWIELSDVVQGLLAQIVYEVSGVDLYQEEQE